jgi:hypothetical protein
LRCSGKRLKSWQNNSAPRTAKRTRCLEPQGEGIEAQYKQCNLNKASIGLSHSVPAYLILPRIELALVVVNKQRVATF